MELQLSNPVSNGIAVFYPDSNGIAFSDPGYDGIAAFGSSF